jgi:hypothetical protein
MAGQNDISAAHFSQTQPVLKTSQKDANGGVSAGNYSIFQSIQTVETYLLANGYTQATLDKMNKNDKIYAARLKIGAAVAP